MVWHRETIGFITGNKLSTYFAHSVGLFAFIFWRERICYCGIIESVFVAQYLAMNRYYALLIQELINPLKYDIEIIAILRIISSSPIKACIF